MTMNPLGLFEETTDAGNPIYALKFLLDILRLLHLKTLNKSHYCRLILLVIMKMIRAA